MYLRHFTLEKAKATGVINSGIISGIYLLTCAIAEGAWTGAVGGGIGGGLLAAGSGASAAGIWGGAISGATACGLGGLAITTPISPV